MSRINKYVKSRLKISTNKNENLRRTEINDCIFVVEEFAYWERLQDRKFDRSSRNFHFSGA